MLYDRDSKLTLISDKLRVRDYVDEMVGDDYLIPLLWHGDCPENIPYDELPERFVVKTNHGCGYVIMVNDKDDLDRGRTQKLLKKWLKENFGLDRFLGIAWGYVNIKPAIVIESFIGEGKQPPDDYKFWCFSGRVEVVSLHLGRFGHYQIGCFDRDFLPYELSFGSHQWSGQFDRPKNFDLMIKFAEELAVGFDFVRVDLYSVGNSIYFGELTPYPGGVSARFLPEKQDKLLGDKWIRRVKSE